MTRLEIMKTNKANYAKLLAEIPNMKGIEKIVAENITLAWIKGSGNTWLGGLSGKYGDRVYEKACLIANSHGYTDDQVYKEFNEQMHRWLDV